MSVFDNHLDHKVIGKDNDRLILEHYKISNSGNTLIPRKGMFALTTWQKKIFRHKTDKIPTGTFKEERSIFRSIPWKLPLNDIESIYPIFEEILHGMNLPCLIYNNKRYYQVNREIKRQIVYKIHNTNN